jgi:hypothetical protein
MTFFDKLKKVIYEIIKQLQIFQQIMYVNNLETKS